MANSNDDDRRTLLKRLTVVAAATFTGAAFGPAVVVALAPGRPGARGATRWIPTVKLDALADGVPKRVVLTADARDAFVTERDKVLGSVWLVKKGEKVSAYSTVCPHLGCSIDVKTGGGFTCPCHDSNFTSEGRCEGGPSPRDMDTLETRVDAGVVAIDFRKFRQGTKDREEIT
ncbi:MAG: Rieske (2Fe-2S) protein [Polyangiaceae bacterium]